MVPVADGAPPPASFATRAAPLSGLAAVLAADVVGYLAARIPSSSTRRLREHRR
jgi:hypothetical protein